MDINHTVSNISLITPTKYTVFIHYVYLLCSLYMFWCNTHLYLKPPTGTQLLSIVATVIITSYIVGTIYLINTPTNAHIYI